MYNTIQGALAPHFIYMYVSFSMYKEGMLKLHSMTKEYINFHDAIDSNYNSDGWFMTTALQIIEVR